MTSDARNKELSESVLMLAAPTQAPNQALTRQPPKNLHNTGLTQASGPQVFFGPICLPFRDGTTGERPTRIKHPSHLQAEPQAGPAVSRRARHPTGHPSHRVQVSRRSHASIPSPEAVGALRVRLSESSCAKFMHFMLSFMYFNACFMFYLCIFLDGSINCTLLMDTSDRDHHWPGHGTVPGPGPGPGRTVGP
jgi:hypothetical protein